MKVYTVEEKFIKGQTVCHPKTAIAMVTARLARTSSGGDGKEQVNSFATQDVQVAAAGVNSQVDLNEFMDRVIDVWTSG